MSSISADVIKGRYYEALLAYKYYQERLEELLDEYEDDFYRGKNLFLMKRANTALTDLEHIGMLAELNNVDPTSFDDIDDETENDEPVAVLRIVKKEETEE